MIKSLANNRTYRATWAWLNDVLPEWLWSCLEKVKNFNYREKSVFFGEDNPQSGFYVIRIKPYPIGLFGYFSIVIGHLIIAQKRGLIPVIDMENYSTTFSEDGEFNGTKNAWEYFFSQTSRFSLSDVYRSSKVILSKATPVRTYGYHTFKCQDSLIEYTQIIKNQISLNETKKNYILKKTLMIGLDDNTLGVFSRGTDYVNIRPKGHPIQPTAEELKKNISTKIVEWGITKIYFVTEDTNLYKQIKNEFGDIILGNPLNKSLGYIDGTLNPISGNSTLSPAERALEYLTDVYILSKCPYFLGSLAGGSMAALLINDNEYVGKKIIDLGVYD